jgi:hypothetical protein
LGAAPRGLWKRGTYWHLATRALELEATSDSRLRSAAPIFDSTLRACPFQTIIHGDAKVANFCFAEDASASVAAVDFQYAGGGTGIQDVAYFLISCSNAGVEATQSEHLDIYFRHLTDALRTERPTLDATPVEQSWRALYPIACADFYRFYAGWAPEAWERDAVGKTIVSGVLRSMEREI